VLLIATLAVTVAALLVIIEVGQLLDEAAHAQLAADAAALAGAAQGHRAAVSVAQANGAELIAYDEQRHGDGSGTVLVSVTARFARATRSAGAEAVTEWVVP